MSDLTPLRPVEARVAHWGLGDAVLAVVVGYAAAVVLSTTWLAITGDSEVTWGLVILSTVGLWVGFAGVPWLVSMRKGRASLAEDYGWRWSFPTDLLIGIAAALVVQLVLLRVITEVFLLLQPDLELSQNAQEMAEDVDGARFAILAVVLVIGAPLAEELFFRGLLLRSLVRRWGRGIGIVVSGLLFGLVHTEAGSAAAVGAVVVGLATLGWVLAWLTERYGRMGPAVCAHITFNLIAVIDIALRR